MDRGCWDLGGSGLQGCAFDIFLERQTQGQIDLMSDARASLAGVALLHLDNGIDDFFGWSLWAWLAPAAW